MSPPARAVQTTLVPAGGATAVEFRIDVPGTYLLVDHAIARALHKGAVGAIVSEGDENQEIFAAGVPARPLRVRMGMVKLNRVPRPGRRLRSPPAPGTKRTPPRPTTPR